MTSRCEIIDLSQPITEQGVPTFSPVDRTVNVTFEEGDSHGEIFLTSRFDNLHSNLATHADLAGHLPNRADDYESSIGEYPLDRFVGPTVVVDFSAKMRPLLTFFDPDGMLNLSLRDSVAIDDFLLSFEEAAISRSEIEEAVADCGTALDKLAGVLIRTGMSRFWRAGTFESWDFAYFFGPYLEDDACTALIAAGVSFVGIDGFQLEHPIVNFRGDEAPLVVNPRARDRVIARLSERSGGSNHALLLGSNRIIYENLRLPASTVGAVSQFAGVPLNVRINGVNDNALVRPYLVVDADDSRSWQAVEEV